MSSTCTTWLQSVASVGRLGEGARPVRAIRPMATGGNATGAGGISVGALASSMETRKVLADVSGSGIVTVFAVVVVQVTAAAGTVIGACAIGRSSAKIVMAVGTE